MKRALLISAFAASACASSEPARAPVIAKPVVEEAPPVAPVVREPMPDNEVTRGELPWWIDVQPGVYRFGRDLVVLAIGDSREHHHTAEGFLHAKVTARLGVRRASEPIRFGGAIPEPELEDLFVTREKRILALYVLRVPKDADVKLTPSSVERPAVLRGNGRHRVGRHVFEGDRHLFLECDVEGPIANPDWGRTRAAARN